MGIVEVWLPRNPGWKRSLQYFDERRSDSALSPRVWKGGALQAAEKLPRAVILNATLCQHNPGARRATPPHLRRGVR
jgi:hypothetical protein